MLIIFGVILLLVLLLVGVGYFYGSRHFVVEESTLYFDDLPDEFDGYRICQFSDFHAFAFHDAVVNISFIERRQSKRRKDRNGGHEEHDQRSTTWFITTPVGTIQFE